MRRAIVSRCIIITILSELSESLTSPSPCKILSNLFSLSYCLIDENTGGYGYVERLYVAELGDRYPLVAQCEVLVGYTLVLGAHHDAERVGEVGLGVGILGLFGSGHHAEPAVLEVLDGIAQVGLAAYGQGM